MTIVGQPVPGIEHERRHLDDSTPSPNCTESSSVTSKVQSPRYSGKKSTVGKLNQDDLPRIGPMAGSRPHRAASRILRSIP
jgi:hypothetical protein